VRAHPQRAEPVVVNLDIEGVADPEHVPWVDPSHP
jgi:hypothetical protein